MGCTRFLCFFKPVAIFAVTPIRLPMDTFDVILRSVGQLCLLLNLVILG